MADKVRLVKAKHSIRKEMNARGRSHKVSVGPAREKNATQRKDKDDGTAPGDSGGQHVVEALGFGSCGSGGCGGADGG